jgi:hypothetical protein
MYSKATLPQGLAPEAASSVLHLTKSSSGLACYVLAVYLQLLLAVYLQLFTCMLIMRGSSASKPKPYARA